MSAQDTSFAGTDMQGLSKLIYVVSGAAVAYALVVRLGAAYLADLVRSGDVTKGAVVARHAYPATLLAYLLAMAVIGIVCWRAGLLGVRGTERGARKRSGVGKQILFGIVGGLLCCAVAVPFMLAIGGLATGLLVNTFADAYGASLVSVLMILLLAIALPIASEVVFRGIVLRVLLAHVSRPAAVVASTMMFVLWWPVMGWYGSAALGIVSGIIYLRTRSLTSAIIANGVLTAGSAITVLAITYR